MPVAVVAGALAALVAASPALAHNSLVSSDPADGAQLAKPPTTVRLTFLSRLDPKTTKVAVTGPDGASVAAGAAAFDRATVRVRIRARLAGPYTVSFQVASDDGHPANGTVRFTVTTGATAPAAPQVTPSPSPRSPRPTVAATVASQGGRPWWPWALGGVVIVGAAAGGLVAARRRG